MQQVLSAALRAIGPVGRFALAALISLAAACVLVFLIGHLIAQAPWAIGYVGAACFLLLCSRIGR